MTYRNKLIRLLSIVQNDPEFANQDILTFTGFMDEREMSIHLLANASYVSDKTKQKIIDAIRAMRALPVAA